ncbi:MAG: hypothetical protein P4L98_11355 [Ancalomicrobiaceae bacterium]|nr:hypothetical protein [Ancalomicrobiaceae bacterium]
MFSTHFLAGALALSLAATLATPFLGATEALAARTGPSSSSSPSSPGTPGTGTNGNNPIFANSYCPRGVNCAKPKVPKSSMPLLCRSYTNQITDGDWIIECKKYYDSDN